MVVARASFERNSDLALYITRTDKKDGISGHRERQMLKIPSLTDPYEPIGHADEEIFFTQLRTWS